MKKVPVVFNGNLTDVQRLEYQLIASLNSTSCAEEEIAPKIKEYIERANQLPTKSTLSEADEIEKLHSLMKKGIISQKEFEQKKNKLLSQ